MHPITYFLTWLRSREKGQGLVEYALILVLIAIVVIAVLAVVGSEISVIFEQIVCALRNGDWDATAKTCSVPTF